MMQNNSKNGIKIPLTEKGVTLTGQKLKKVPTVQPAIIRSAKHTVPVLDNTSSEPDSKANYKTIMCKFGKNCSYGERCRCNYVDSI